VDPHTTRQADPAVPVVRSYVVWAVGVLAYVLSIMQRTTLGVSGLDAAERFSISPGVLSSFVFVQMIVYVAMQIPAGLLVDRWGARSVVFASAVTAAIGQLLLAVTTTLPVAVLARVVVGAADALMFVGVLALLPRWFPARRVPLVTQLTAILGQLGQILSAVPFLAVLHRAGWSVAFGSAGALSMIAGVLALAVVRNAPGGCWSPKRSASAGEIMRQLRAIWRRPGTRLASSVTWPHSSR
jgi:MFS family permease